MVRLNNINTYAMQALAKGTELGKVSGGREIYYIANIYTIYADANRVYTYRPPYYY